MDELVAAEPDGNVRDCCVARAAALVKQQVARGEACFAVDGLPLIYLRIVARAVSADLDPCAAQSVVHKAGAVKRIRAFRAEHIGLALLRERC